MARPRPERVHPHAEAVYRIVAEADSRFAVEVIVPGASPALVRSFASEQDAEAWIARHKESVVQSSSRRGWFRKPAQVPPTT